MTEVRYYIAQYIADPFRREQKNLGLIAVSDDKWRAKFFAERPKGGIDKRRARGLVNHPDIYEQWVDYWRRKLARNGADAIAELLSAGLINYQVIDGGQMANTSDNLTAITHQLYSMLVHEDAIGDATPKTKVQQSLKNEFKRRSILYTGKDALTDIVHPVRENARVNGSRTGHRPSFVQQNDALYVIETLECTTPRTEWRLKERAGYASNMFDDIRDANASRSVHAIAVVNISREVRSDREVKYARKVAESSANEIVDWRDKNQRESFLLERQKIATDTD